MRHPLLGRRDAGRRGHRTALVTEVVVTQIPDGRRHFRVYIHYDSRWYRLRVDVWYIDPMGNRGPVMGEWEPHELRTWARDIVVTQAARPCADPDPVDLQRQRAEMLYALWHWRTMDGPSCTDAYQRRSHEYIDRFGQHWATTLGLDIDPEP